ncbi:MAG: hypothetical protein MI923_21800 [Phycisphaerales bacterium]|nr:hypothetical protein [Phycisphaerales bacterium]
MISRPSVVDQAIQAARVMQTHDESAAMTESELIKQSEHRWKPPQFRHLYGAIGAI